MTANWMVTGGATLQLNNATALGSGMVNLNGGNLKAQHDATYNNTLTVSGSSGLTVNAATQFSNVTLAAAGSLNMNGGTLGIAAAGSLTLGRVRHDYGKPDAGKLVPPEFLRSSGFRRVSA